MWLEFGKSERRVWDRIFAVALKITSESVEKRIST
jgi:hypothetical protein